MYTDRLVDLYSFYEIWTNERHAIFLHNDVIHALLQRFYNYKHPVNYREHVVIFSDEMINNNSRIDRAIFAFRLLDSFFLTH